MRNIYKYIFSGLIIFFIIILAINGNKREYKKEESFSVYLSSKGLIDIPEIKKLVSCASKGINGEKKCKLIFDI